MQTPEIRTLPAAARWLTPISCFPRGSCRQGRGGFGAGKGKGKNDLVPDTNSMQRQAGVWFGAGRPFWLKVHAMSRRRLELTPQPVKSEVMETENLRVGYYRGMGFLYRGYAETLRRFRFDFHTGGDRLLKIDGVGRLHIGQSME